MRFRLPGHLPLEARIGGASYLVELVQHDSNGQHWLRARHRDEPIVFLLAPFETATAAAKGLANGFEVVGGDFPRALFHQLVAEGLADICVPRRPERAVGRVTALPREAGLLLAAS